MKYVTLGNTGLEVSELCYGTLILGPLQAGVPAEEGALAIRCGAELGINFFDTAQAYRTYEHLRLGLAGITEVAGRPLVFASKTMAKTADDARAAVEEARRELGRERIDIFLLHNVFGPEDLESRAGALEYLLRAKAEGLVGYVGLSTHSVAGADLAARRPEFEVVLPIINKVGRGLRSGTMPEMIAATQAAHAAGKATYAMKMLAGGHLVGEFPEHLRWGRQLECLHAITVGMKTVEEVEADVAIFEDRDVPANLTQTLASQKRIKVLPGQCAGCGSCVEVCPAGALRVNEAGKAECDHSLCILCGYCGGTCEKFAIRLV